MQLSVIGAGTMGLALARRFTAAGHEVVVGTRNPDRAPPASGFSYSSHVEALAFGEASFLALPWPHGIDLLGRTPLSNGRILVDVSNPESEDGRGLSIGWSSSGAEELSRVCPSARVIKAFNHFYAELLDATPGFDGGPPSVLCCGDDSEAKRLVGEVIKSCGLDPIDAGPLAVARYLEPLAMLTVGLVREQGFGPTGMAWKVLKGAK